MLAAMTHQNGNTLRKCRRAAWCRWTVPAAAVAVLVSTSVISPSLAGPAAALTGDWRTPAGATVRIEPCGPAPCGRLIDFKPLPGRTLQSQRDERNRDRAKRTRKVLGLTVLWRVERNNEGWRARVYDPRRGFGANATLTLDRPGRLKVKGCVKVLFRVCEQEVWRRVR